MANLAISSLLLVKKGNKSGLSFRLAQAFKIIFSTPIYFLLLLLWSEFPFYVACASKPFSYLIFCAGNSLTEQGYPIYLRQLLREKGFRVRIYNYGRSGHNSKEYLAYLRNQESKLKALQPDFILLELGTNDVRVDGDRISLPEFEANMREIIKIFSDFRTRWGEKPRIILALIPPIKETGFPFSPQSAQRVEAEINPAILRLALENGLGFVDHWSLFQEKSALLPGIHPNPDGYREMARLWLQALLPYLSLKR